MKIGSIAMHRSGSSSLNDRLAAGIQSEEQQPPVGEINVPSKLLNNDDAGTFVTESSGSTGEEVTSKETSKETCGDVETDPLYTPNPSKIRAQARIQYSEETAQIRGLAKDTNNRVKNIQELVNAQTPKRTKEILAENHRLKRELKMRKQGSNRSSRKGDSVALDHVVKGSRTHISQKSKENTENASTARRKNVNNRGRMNTT
jgi:hypothetical protein